MVLLGITSCSAIGFFYNRADYYILKQVDRYLNLSNDQTGQLRKSLQSTLQKHRDCELPLYIAYLDYVDLNTRNTLTQEKADEILKNVNILYARFIMLLLPALTPIFSDLSNEQIHYLDKRQQEFNEEQTEIWEDEKLGKKRVKSYKFWLGYVTKEQEDLIITNANLNEPLERLWAEWRVEKQHAFNDFLLMDKSNDEIHDFLYGWWANGDDKSDELRNVQKNAYERTLSLAVKIFSSLEKKQHINLQKRLNGFSEDLKELIDESRQRDIQTYRELLDNNLLQLSSNASCLSDT